MLSLLSILVFLTYAISSVSKVAGEVSAASVYQKQARQNALIGLSVAIEKLQSAAGRNVVTASASIRGLSVKFPSLLGIWDSGDTNALPPNWMVSGNFETKGANQITYLAMPSDPPGITLVGSKTVTAASDKVIVSRVQITDTDGGYAFWVGDEGSKVSLGFDASEVPLSTNGSPLLPDPRGEISTFLYSSTIRSRVLVWDQIKEISPGASLKSRFHAYAAKCFWVDGSGNMQAGLFNINTTEEDAWAAVLRCYEAARATGQPVLSSENAADLAGSLVGNFSRSTGSAKVRYGPFRTVDAFWDSNIMQDSLDEEEITTVTQDDIRIVLTPLLAVRSDTFRIRAYGDAMNPADAGLAGATPESVAYCEAIVQRTTEDDPGGNGKKFVITYFRWLGPDDI